jgi:hypothetical protein
MSSQSWHTQTKHVAVSVAVIALVVATSSVAEGQTTPELFTMVETLTLSDGTPVSGTAAISGDTAVVGHDGVVTVFHRPPGGDHWVERATLVASDGTSEFGTSVAIDGRTIIVGAASAAFVFERIAGLGWQEIKKLSGDTNAVSFGASVAVSRATVVVGAPYAGESLIAPGPGLAYVFERDEGGSNMWGEVARLVGPAHPLPGMFDAFGNSVAIDLDTVVVGAASPRHPPDGYTSSSSGFVFTRDHGGLKAWGRVAELPLGVNQDTFAAVVSIDGDTAVVARHGNGASARIFQRDQDGPNAWGDVTFLGPSRAGLNYVQVGISGDRVVVSDDGSGPFYPRVVIYARHQGENNAWGEVDRLLPEGSAYSGDTVAISGDTVFVGNYNPLPVGGERTPIDVYVADTDRDGVRDGRDPCPRDPLNNVGSGCQRASAVHPVLDESIAQDDVTSETQGRRQIITATFTNTSDTAIQNPFFEITELTGGNVLLNGDAGRGGIGATLSLDVGDGILSPGESMTVTFRIRLRTHDPFQFFVTFHGDPVP